MHRRSLYRVTVDTGALRWKSEETPTAEVRMGLLDKARGLVKGNEAKVKGGIDKGSDVIDDKTGGKHSARIDTGAEKAKDAVDKMNDDA